MDPCHSVSPRSPAFTSALTVAHLIRNIEQLKNKDKLISQLEKDLGHQWVAAQLAALERENVEGAQAPALGAPSHPLGALPEDSHDPTPFTWTPTSTPTTGGVEEARSTHVEGFSTGKPDLPKAMKDCKERNKELVEKCRGYLQRTKELTAQNRAYKDSSEKVLKENKKMQELLEHSKLRVLHLTRQLNEALAEKTNIERQNERLDELRKEMMEDKKTISALKQACSDKDRRIELIQHRKKRRRLMGSAEKSMGVKETFFGYDEDTKSVDSEHSVSSLSHSTISDDDVWDDVMSREETERHYQRLMMEQLQLQKSYAQLQRQSEQLQDPQREALAKMSLQNDLFSAQCRIEKLEKLINEIGEGEVITLLKERETIVATNKEFLEKAQFWENECRRTQQELTKAQERSEDLEFQLMEMEHLQDEGQNSSCEENTSQPLEEGQEFVETLAQINQQQAGSVRDMEQLRKELAVLLKGKGREGDAVLKKLDQVTSDEKHRAKSVESMAHELQMKVISLQKEKDILHDQLAQKGHKPGKGETAASIAAAREKQENLELKNEIARLSSSESKLLSERIHLLEQLEDWKTQYDALKHQVDILTQTKHQRKQRRSLKVETCGSDSSGSSTPPSPSSSQLSRRPSKDRKSKPRSGDDPTETKRRRSSKDVPSSESSQSNLKAFRSFGDVKMGSGQQSFMRSFNSIDDIQTMTEAVDDVEAMKEQLRVMESQLEIIKEENFSLRDQLKQCALEKSSEAEADQQFLLDRVEVLESEVDLLRRENEALAHKLKRRMDELSDSQDEMNPRVTELEDYCEDLQEQLRMSENSERQMRDKLKLLELSFDDAENSEMAIREKYEEQLQRETEAKKQINELQRTGRELRDIVLDKDIVEQALRDKVDFLQKAEAASVKRIEELEAIEKDLREQLEVRSDPKDACQRELNKIQELKHQITFLETDNKALSARVSELEENEEILRENWRRVADEDYNRTQCLEEKVKMLDAMNSELKSKLKDAQEYFVINTVAPSENSLADELARSQSQTLRLAAAYESPDEGDDNDSVDGTDGPESLGSSQVDTSYQDTERRNMKEKLRKLEKQLSDVSEQKNSKIESLQEKIVSLKENEVKLTETIAEMEMTERELKAKLALYESSEVTVEKMLKYQSKIEELRTSQESLLDQIESMENQEMTLQEKMQEMERTLRGKIVTLEVEMKGFKQKELKDAARIRELEKQEKELSEKVAQQAEKENGLYVKISALMDEVKALKEENESLKTRTAEKDDKVRKAQLLEVKLLEIEMEHGKKLSDLSSKLRRKEEELRHKESAHQEEMAVLQSELVDSDSEKAQRISIMEKMFAQKEKDLQSTIDSLNENIKELTNDRDEYELQVNDLQQSNTDLKEKDLGYEQELDILRQEVGSIKSTEKEYEEKIAVLEEEVNKAKKRAEKAESKVESLEKELAKQKGTVREFEQKVISLKADITEKMKNIESGVVEKESEYEREKQSLQEELALKGERVRELEKELAERMQHMRDLESECEKLKSEAALREKASEKKIANLEKLMAEKEKRLAEKEVKLAEKEVKLAEMQRSLTEKDIEFEEQMHSWEAEFDVLQGQISEKNKMIEELQENSETKEKEHSDKISALKSEQETKEKEQKQSLSSKTERLQKDVEKHRQDLLEKLSELEAKNKENCELSLEISNMRHASKTLQNEFDNFKDMSRDTERKHQKQLSEQAEKLEKLKQELETAHHEIDQFKLEISQKENVIQEVNLDKEKFVKEKQLEVEKLLEERSHKEVVIQEHMQKSESMQQESASKQKKWQTDLDTVQKDLIEKDAELQQKLLEITEKDSTIHDLQSESETLKHKLSEMTQNLESKTSEAEQHLQELDETKKSNLSEIENLQQQLKEKHQEIEVKTSEHSDTQSLISAKQQELEQARIELQKCLQEIEQYKNNVQEKENELARQDQTYKEISADFEDLNQKYEERDQEYKTIKTKVTDVEHKLVEAENRYRELEAKCASLELQLEERFAQAQEAEKVIKLKEEECQQLMSKLGTMEKEHEEVCSQAQQAEQVFKEKERECQHLKSKLEEIEKKCEKMQESLDEKEKSHRETVDKFGSLEREHEQLKEERQSLQHNVTTSVAQRENSVKEIEFLRKQVVSLENSCEDMTSQLEASEDRLREAGTKYESLEGKLREKEKQVHDGETKCAALQADLKVVEKKVSEAEKALEASQGSVVELENSIKNKDETIQKLRSDLKDNEKLCAEIKANLQHAENDLRAKNSQLEVLKNKMATTEEDLKNSEEDCNKLKEKLSASEDRLLLSTQNVSELTGKISILEKALDEKESYYQDSQSGLESLEQRHLESQIECQNLKSKLDYFQKMLANAQAAEEENEEKLKEIEAALDHTKKELSETQDKLSEKESECNDLQSQLQHARVSLNSSQQEMEEYSDKISSLETKLRDQEVSHEKIFHQLEEKEATCQKLEKELESIENELETERSKLSQAESDMESTKLKLMQSEQSCSETLSELKSFLEEKNSTVAEHEKKYAELKAQHEKLQGDKDSKSQALESLETVKADLASSMSQLEQENAALKTKLEETQEMLHSSESGQNELVNTNQSLSGKLYQLEHNLSDRDGRIAELEGTISELTAEKEDAEKRVKSLEDEKKQLEADIVALQEELEDASKEFENLRNDFDESKSGVEVKVNDLSRSKEKVEKELKKAHTELKDKTESLSKLSEENAELRKALEEQKNIAIEMERKMEFIEDANSEARSTCEKLSHEKGELLSKASEIQESHDQLQMEFAKVKGELSNLRTEKGKLETELSKSESCLSERIEIVSKLGMEMDNLHTENDSLKSKVVGLEKECADLLQRIEEHDSMSEDKNVVSESEIQVSVAAGLQMSAPQLHEDCQDQLRSELSSLESHHNETVHNMEKLMHEIEAYKTADRVNQEKLNELEKTLKDMREKEARLSERVSELEGKEKEMHEQIADIEANVIVPLETENQELKDELSVVRQERDDARAKISKWGYEDDEDDQQDVESVHKCLEDALFQRDELEKKVNILCEDIAKLEIEKEGLQKKVTDLEAVEAEYMEKIESLEEEAERFHNLERSKSVVEEAETRLMDRVLDLEEKEQLLTAELEQLRNKDTQSRSVQTEEEIPYGAMVEKLKYLQQKHEVLQDAEGRYMDKIMELEESQHRLQYELTELRVSQSKNPKASTEPTIVSGSGSVQLFLQPTVQTSVGLSSSGATAQTTHNTVSTDTADLVLPSEQTSNLSELPEQTQTQQLEKHNQSLAAECEEQKSEIKYLKEKLELLEDSEARLMEKLLDSEETKEDSVDTKAISSEEYENLKTKVENLTEENEFLAQNVENYKQLYKEEKEKTNDLHDRVMETSSVHQELHDTRAELKSTQQMVEEIQSEYEEQLSQTEQHESELNNLLAQAQEKEKDLQSKISDMEHQQEELQKQLNSLMESQENPHALQSWMEQEKADALSKQEAEFRSLLQQKEAELQTQLTSLQDQLETQENHHRQQAQELEKQIHDMKQHEEELLQQMEVLSQRERSQQEEMARLKDREEELTKTIGSLEKQLQEMQAAAEAAKDHKEEEDSVQSDSGLSADDQRTRYDNTEKARSQKQRAPEPPVAEEVFSSKVTLNLSRSPSPGIQKSSADRVAAQPVVSSHDGQQVGQTTYSAPVAPPRRRRSRPASIDSVSHEELIFLVEELQNKELALKKRIRDLESLADSDQSQRVAELECLNQTLERRLRYAESSNPSLAAASVALESSKASAFGAGGDSNNNNTTGAEEEAVEEESKELDRSFSSVLSSSSSRTMLDKPEDVLQQRIRELENLDKHNKNQLSELERDREVLHEIARKDKTTIHDLNVKIRELQLSERSLKEQVNSLEVSEGSLYTKCEDLEATKAKLEDRVHELEIHERRLRELVRKLKLDEEHWLSKSGGMETAVAELSANEQQLKRLLQDVEMEKGGLSERADYLEARIRELENVEATLLQRLKNYENIEVSLQNRLVHLENSEAAAHSKAAELDVMNMDFSQRLQKAVEENAVLSQHVTQLQGQIQDLDRRLMSSRDSELAYKQHVESLQKNESSLQKKVREYELREIDSQARVRELEQTNDILNDKMATLQRSENRLKFRVQELEGMGGQIPGELNPDQRQKVPQKLEDCQKRVVVLQNQVENLQLQLKEALTNQHTKLASQMDDGEKLSIPVDEYSDLQTKSALLEETTYQMEEVERLNEQLNQTILELRQGKGASGHEVEIEVLKRRLASYKTFISKLKSSLSAGQATSLMDPELDSGPQGETLPARHLHGLESERVLQSVRGLHDGKADTYQVGGAQQYGLSPEEDFVVQSKATSSLSSQPASVDLDDDSGSNKPEQASSREESHWRAIEARKPKLVASSRGGVFATHGEGAKQAPPTKHNGSKRSSTPEVEEVTIGLHLPSESELSSHHRTTQNDTDSSDNPVRPPRRGRARVVKNSYNLNNSGTESSDGLSADDTPARAAAATNNKHYFGNDKSLPSPANKTTSEKSDHGQKQASLTRFGEDSFYLPSSTQEGVDSLDDDDEAPPLPSSRPPGAEGSGSLSSPRSSQGSMEQLPQERKDSLENSTSGMSIRERIAMIEKQLQSDTQGNKADEQEFYWKRKATESMKQVEVLEKDNKHLKEDINRLEKELEEKRRYINLLELWLSNLEDLLKNKNKQTDREMVEQLQLELSKLRGDLKHVGYRSEDAVLDPAALKTELEHRDKEIVSKRGEIDMLNRELKRCQEECRSIEGMRRTALDSVRALEHEVIGLQETEKRLKETQAELQTLKAQTEKTREVYEENLSLRDRVHQNEVELIRLRNVCDDFNNLSARYDELEHYKNQAVNMIQPLQAKLERLARKCQERDALLHRLGDELRRNSYRPSSALDDLTRLERVMSLEEYNTDFPRISNGPPPQRPERRGGHSRSSSMEELEMHLPFSDSESTTMPVTTSKRKRPTPYVNNRPRSAETLGSGPRAQRGAHAHPRLGSEVRRFEGHHRGMGLGTMRGQFVAIADYDPALFSQSGRPRLELELKEGDHVLVTGPMDRTGYYEAEVNGRSGLVPANYLQPLQGSSHMLSRDVWSDDGQLDHSPDHVVAMSRPLQQEAFTRHKDDPRGQRPEQATERRKHSGSHGPFPDPPHNLHVKSIVNERSILLSWFPPKLDNKGNNNGLKVLGYMVYLNNQEYEQIPSPKMCEVVVEDLNPDQPHHLAVQSLCAGGKSSPRAELVFEGIVKMVQAKESGASNGQTQEDLDTDLSSVLNSAQYKRGHRKTVIALYDYNPQVQSPNDYTAFELAFQAGDVIHVYGEPRPDGFFHGEIDDERGLVPACFVEDISKLGKSSQKPSAEPESQANTT